VNLGFRGWRGFLVAATWIVWPPICTVLVYFADFMTSNSRKCSIEGCDLSAGWMTVLVLGGLALPLPVTLLWLRWRSRNVPEARAHR
jgi:hypothetical protein